MFENGAISVSTCVRREQRRIGRNGPTSFFYKKIREPKKQVAKLGGRKERYKYIIKKGTHQAIPNKGAELCLMKVKKRTKVSEAAIHTKKETLKEKGVKKAGRGNSARLCVEVCSVVQYRRVCV